MKKPITIFAFMILAAMFGSTAKAVSVNPADWNFFLISYGTAASWTSSTNVETGYPQYDYSWQLTKMDLKLAEDGDEWVSVLDSIPAGDRSGSGTAYGLGFEILDHRFESSGVFGADTNIYVDAGGFGHVSADNIYFGSYEGHNVVGLGMGGDITVTAIPEPTAIALLSVGALLLLRRRRQEKDEISATLHS